MGQSGSRKSVVAGVLALSMVTQVARATEPPAPTLVKMAPAPVAAPRVGLRVDAEKLGTSGESVEAKVVETAEEVFAAEGFEEASGDQDPVIVVVVEPTGTEENPGFVVGYSIEKGEEVVAGSARQSDCSLCTRTELLERIREELPGLLKLARDQQAPVEAGGEEEGGAEEEGGGEDEGGTPEEIKPIGPMGFAGIGLSVVGLAGVGVGVAFAVKGFEPKPPDYLEQTNYRTPGNIVLAIGGAALITGVVLIGVDVAKRKKQRKAGKSETRLRIEPRGAGFAF